MIIVRRVAPTQVARCDPKKEAVEGRMRNDSTNDKRRSSEHRSTLTTSRSPPTLTLISLSLRQLLLDKSARHCYVILCILNYKYSYSKDDSDDPHYSYRTRRIWIANFSALRRGDVVIMRIFMEGVLLCIVK